jgi:hypothetical protein
LSGSEIRGLAIEMHLAGLAMPTRISPPLNPGYASA